jgi:hypothetical protein
MKLKVLIAALFVAGFASSFALAGGTRGAADTTTGATTTGATTTPDRPKCQSVELRGSDGAGTLTFTVTKASKKGSALAGKPVTLAIAAGAKVHASACIDAAGALTLRHLELTAAKPAKAKPAKKSEKG